jgi:hypothetical protein
MSLQTARLRKSAPRFGVFGLVTVVALYLTWAAVHDITHGEADLKTEYVFLGVCAAWFAYAAVSTRRFFRTMK